MAEGSSPKEEIEITPAMIEAGAAEIAFYSPETGTIKDVAVDVYIAMETVRWKALSKEPARK